MNLPLRTPPRPRRDRSPPSPRWRRSPPSSAGGGQRSPCAPQRCGQSRLGASFQKAPPSPGSPPRSEEHTSELQSRENLVCRLLLEKKKRHIYHYSILHQQTKLAAKQTHD